MNFSQNVKLEIEEKINSDEYSSKCEFNFNDLKEDENLQSGNFFELNSENFNNYKGSNILINQNHSYQKELKKKKELIKNDYLTTIKSKFKERLRDMKSNTEIILENIRTNFNNYVDEQKIHLVNSLNTIEHLFEVESTSAECENEKMKQLEKKMMALSLEINGFINDLKKFTN